ncbi:hypothetical protein JT05_06790 [Desulfosporosinus sp. Tol-M]|nr:hypothetical protein JT05_06790 [Desulfosporosinus sp. Tol-M]
MILNNNRGILFQQLLEGVEELISANGIDINVDIESFAAGFQGVVSYTLAFIKSMEENNLKPEEIITKIKTTFDDGSYSVIN